MQLVSETISYKLDCRYNYLQVFTWRLLGLIPWSRNLRNLPYGNISYKIYVSAMVIATIIAYAIIMHERFVKSRWDYNRHVVSFLAIGSLFVLNLFILINDNFVRSNEYDEVIDILCTLDHYQSKYVQKSGRIKWRFLLETVIIRSVIPMLSFAAHMSYKDHWWLNMEFFLRYQIIFAFLMLQQNITEMRFRYEIIEKIVAEYVEVMILILAAASEKTSESAKKVGSTCYNSIHRIKFGHRNVDYRTKQKYEKYRDANVLLEDVVARSEKEMANLTGKYALSRFKREYSVKHIIRIYIGLNKIIDCINKLYGWTLLCLNINIISSLLLSFDFIIEYTSEANVLREKSGMSFIFLMLIWSVFSLILGVLLANLAHSTVLEIQNTSRLSYKLLQYIPCDTSNMMLEEMREDLVLLSEQMSLRTPSFSAAGFFSIDYTMLFTLLSSITSYLVVLIQFN
ncbi:hypothetical protein Trydic_g6420 [Trypoxylus dichotomus]